MSYDHHRHHRRSIRQRGYDYSQAGTYFITICTQGPACLFGKIVDGKMLFNATGRLVDECWNDIPAHFPHVELDEFAVMPNHVHGILSIIETVGAKNVSPLPSQQRPGTSKTIGSIICGFKIGPTKWIRANTDIRDVWQRNYYEHIIRDDASLNRIRQYIMQNPPRWAEDFENPENVAVTIGPNAVGAKKISPLLENSLTKQMVEDAVQQ